MGAETKGELIWLFAALILGIAAGLVYDFIRPLRNHWGKAAGIILDVIYAAAGGISLFIFAMASENCRLGLWQLSASFLGFVGYLYTLSPLISPALNSIYGQLTVFVENIKILLKKFQISAKNLFKKM